jgi:hypothetical protein
VEATVGDHIEDDGITTGHARGTHAPESGVLGEAQLADTESVERRISGFGPEAAPVYFGQDVQHFGREKAMPGEQDLELFEQRRPAQVRGRETTWRISPRGRKRAGAHVFHITLDFERQRTTRCAYLRAG